MHTNFKQTKYDPGKVCNWDMGRLERHQRVMQLLCNRLMVFMSKAFWSTIAPLRRTSHSLLTIYRIMCYEGLYIVTCIDV